jgi:hypothetical protein
MSVPQFARISRKELGDIPSWAQQMLDHYQPQIEFLTQDANGAKREIIRTRIAHDKWMRVALKSMKKPAIHVTVSAAIHASIAWRGTPEKQKYDVNIHFDPAPADPTTTYPVTIEFRAE